MANSLVMPCSCSTAVAQPNFEDTRIRQNRIWLMLSAS